MNRRDTSSRRSSAAEITRTLSISYGIQTVNNILNLDFEGYWYGFGAAHLTLFLSIIWTRQRANNIDWRICLKKIWIGEWP